MALELTIKIEEKSGKMELSMDALDTPGETESEQTAKDLIVVAALAACSLTANAVEGITEQLALRVPVTVAQQFLNNSEFQEE